MNKRNVKVPTSGFRKFFETLKFVLRAILFAFILVNLGKIWGIVSNVFTWCTETDLGYVWVINIAAGAAVAGLIGLITHKSREKYPVTIGIVKTIIFILVVLAAECFIWHLKDSWEVLKAPIESSDIIVAVLGLVAATLSFIWHLHGVNYGGDDYYEEEYEAAPSREVREHAPSREVREPAQKEGGEEDDKKEDGEEEAGIFKW